MSITNASSRYDPRQVIRQYGNLKKDVANKEEAFGTMNVTENLAICMAKDRGKKGKISDDSGKYIILKGQQPVKNRSSVDGSSVLESFQYKISFKNRRELAKLLQDPKLLETTLHLMERADKLKDSGAVTELQKIADNRKAPRHSEGQFAKNWTQFPNHQSVLLHLWTCKPLPPLRTAQT